MTPKKVLTIQFTALFALLSIPAPRASAQNTFVQPRITQAVEEGTRSVSQADRISGPIGSDQMVTMAGHIPHNARSEYDQGPVDSSFQLNEVTLLTLPSASQQKALDRLVAEQQDPSSPNYHKWLTPEEYANRFGLSVNDVQKISTWLKSQGLNVISVARGRNWIVFSGTASQIGSAFRTEIHHYNVNGEVHFANATAPSIPAALAGITTGIRGLDDFHPKPTSIRKAPQVQTVRPNFFDNCCSFPRPDFLAPGDIATIYDLKPLYSAGIDGTGQELVIVGQTDIFLADINDFRTGFGLSPISCTTNSNNVITACNSTNFKYVLDGTDPGVSPRGDVTESDLDIEWSGATARGAQIIFVNSNDVFTSFYFAIDNKLAPVISMSYAACEFGDDNLVADEAELTKSNTFGITFVNSSGDIGAAECDFNDKLAVNGLAVAFPASSPAVTGVGGTATPVSDFTSTFWGTTNATDGGTALSYIPETSWNDDVELVGMDGATPQAVQENIGIASSGGGASNCSVQNAGFTTCVSGFPQPSWQTVTIPGQASARFSPDVSLLASANFPGYIICTQLSELGDNGTGSSCGSGGSAGILASMSLPQPAIFGGTSVSAPVFAGIVALLNQDLGSTGLGNINPMLYSLSKTTSNKAFHQVTTGSNVVFCEVGTPSDMPVSYRCPSSGFFGFNASNADPSNGYNLVTGLGSVDANALFTAWKASSTTPSFSLSVSPSALTIASAGGSANTTVTITGTTGFTGTVTLSCSGLPTGTTCIFGPPSSVSVSGTTPVAVPLMLTSSGSGMLSPMGHRSTPPAGQVGTGRLVVFFAWFAIMWLVIQAGRRRIRWNVVAGFLVAACLIGVASCGGGSSSSSGGGGGNPVPQTVTVTGSDGTNTHSTTFALTID